MPSSPTHNARQVALSSWKACSNLSFKWCIVLDVCGLALLVTGLSLISLGYSPSKTRPSRLGEVPIDRGNTSMQIAGLVILPIGALCFFTGLALTVKSVRSAPVSKDEGRVVNPVSVSVRPAASRQPQQRPGRPTSNPRDGPLRYATVSDGVYAQLPPPRVSAPRLSTATSASSDVFYIEQYDVTPRRNVPAVYGVHAPTPAGYTRAQGPRNYQAPPGTQYYNVNLDYDEAPPPFNPNYQTRHRY